MSRRLRYRRLLAAFVGGIVFPLGFAPFDLWPFAIVSIAALFYIWDRAVGPRDAALAGFVWGLGAFQAGLYWLNISVHVFGGAPLWLSLFLMVGTVSIMAAYVALVGYLSFRLLPRAGLWRWLIGLPALWVLAEWLRSWLFSGFGWLAPGYAMIDTPLAGYAPLGGVLLISAMTAVTAGALVAWFHSARKPQVIATVTVTLLWLAGFGLSQVPWTEVTGKPIRASLLQGAVSQDKKWLPEQLGPTIRLYIKMTEQAIDSDLIIWPEAAIPALYRSIETPVKNLEALVKDNDAALLFGIPRGLAEENQYANSLVALGGSTRHIYDKRHLVPFGEYFPVPDFVRNWMRLRGLPYVDYIGGDARQPPIPAAGQKIAVTICYEDLFGYEQRHGLDQTTLLVNVSNDAWFGDSIAAHQHLQIARMRALETGRPMLRATNTGISAIIDHTGRIRDRSPQFKVHTLTGTVQGRRGLTPYVRLGDWPLVLLAVLAAGLIGRRQLAG